MAQRLAPAALSRRTAAVRPRALALARPAVAARGVLVVLAMLVLAAGVVAAAGISAPRLGALLGGDGRVVWVTPDGAAARAGLRAGDVLTSINRQGVSASALTASGGQSGAGLVMLGAGTAGSFRLYVIAPAAPSLAEMAGDGAALAAALALWLTGLLAGLPRRRPAAARLYALAALCLALALCTLVALDGSTLWPRLVAVPAVTVGLAALLLAQLSLSGRLPRPLTGTVIALAGVAAVLAALGAVVALPGPATAVAAAILAALALAALVGPLTVHATTGAEPQRRQLRVALAATLAGLAPLYLWPGLAVLAALSGRSYAPPLPAHTSALWYTTGLVVMALLYAALFATKDARRLDARTRAAASYLVALALVAGALIATLAHVALPGAGIAVAAAVVTFPLMQRGLERLFDRALRRPAPRYSHALRTLEDLAATAAAPRDLATATVRDLPRLLAVRGTALLLRGLDCAPAQYRLVTASGEDAVAELDAALEPGAAEAARPTPWEALPAQPPPALAARISPALWAPLWWDGAQRGVLLLEARLDGDPFGGEDLRQIEAIAGLLALAYTARQLVASVHERTEALVHLTHRLSHAHEQERAHLSRELHDVVAQELIALTRQLRRYGDAATPPPAAIWADMLAGAQDALTATRRICNGLRPAILDLGLTPALRDLVADAAERADGTRGAPEVSLTVEGAERRFSAELEFALFRVVQEGVNNAVAHSGARQVRIEACFNGGVCVRVRDDGRGFVVPSRFEDLPGDHLGLIGMRERLAEFGGALTVSSRPGRGTVLEASVPADEQ